MKAEEKLLSKFGRDPGYRVPDGYFDEIYKKISASKGELPREESPVPVTRWVKIRPYVYLAAMFAGIWCMLKMFTMMGDIPKISLDNMPEQVAQAVQEDDNVYSEFKMAENLQGFVKSDYELETDLHEAYADFSEFEEDFDYDFEDQYADISLP